MLAFPFFPPVTLPVCWMGGKILVRSFSLVLSGKFLSLALLPGDFLMAFVMRAIKVRGKYKH